jgi:hypothetical protein
MGWSSPAKALAVAAIALVVAGVGSSIAGAIAVLAENAALGALFSVPALSGLVTALTVFLGAAVCGRL